MPHNFGVPSIYGTGQRDWTFKYKAGDLIAKADAKATYHKERIVFWTDELDKAKKEYMESVVPTLPFQDPSLSNYAYIKEQAHGGIRQRIDNATRKIESHRETVNEATRMSRAFTLHPAQEIELSIYDIEFFRL